MSDFACHGTGSYRILRSLVPVGTGTPRPEASHDRPSFRDPGRARGDNGLRAVARLTNVVKTYDDDGLKVTAVNGISLDIPRQRFAMIVGPSGSGKTTLLNLIGCIDLPTSGSIEVCGEAVAQLRDNALTDFRARNISFVFQNFNLFPVLSAFENVEYPLLLIGMPAAERRRRVDGDAGGGRPRRSGSGIGRTSFPADRSSASPSRARW